MSAYRLPDLPKTETTKKELTPASSYPECLLVAVTIVVLGALCDAAERGTKAVAAVPTGNSATRSPVKRR